THRGALLLLLRLGLVAGYPSGRVTESCGDMVPRHGHAPLPDPVHSVTVARTTFTPGDQIEVAVSGPEFKGFLIEARDAEDPSGAPVGSFTLIDSQESQLLTCGEKQGSAVSHTNAHKKTEVRVYWDAPDSAPNHVQFLFVFPERTPSTWYRACLRRGEKCPPSSPPPRAPGPGSPAPSFSQFSASGCGSKKFCRSPSACDPEKEGTCLFLSFTRDDQSVTVEMSGPSKGYLSFALSHDRWMGDDDAYLCIHEDQTVSIRPAHLMGRSHPALDSWDALEDMAWRLEDGGMQCSFRRNITLPGVKNRFDLNTSYYIFLATGAAKDGRIYRHSQQPLITYEKHAVTGDPQDVGASRAPPLLRAHGALMLVSWMTTVSVGVIVARFYKPVLSRPLFGESAWFQVHRALMLITSSLTCIAFVLPFIYRGGWSSRMGKQIFIIIIVTTITTTITTVFKMTHTVTSLGGDCMDIHTWLCLPLHAVAAMFLGMDLPGLALPGPWKTYTMLGFVAWHVGAEIVLEVHSYRLSRKVEILDDTRIQIMQTFTMAEAEGHGFKKAVLAVYVCGNLTFLVIFLSAVSRL
uniref:Ferric-chelate reductase 1 n=1 Tax=Myotis lucifugus TaxID=59463 RepID=G1Q6Q3_MYOLU